MLWQRTSQSPRNHRILWVPVPFEYRLFYCLAKRLDHPALYHHCDISILDITWACASLTASEIHPTCRFHRYLTTFRVWGRVPLSDRRWGSLDSKIKNRWDRRIGAGKGGYVDLRWRRVEIHNTGFGTEGRMKNDTTVAGREKVMQEKHANYILHKTNEITEHATDMRFPSQDG